MEKREHKIEKHRDPFGLVEIVNYMIYQLSKVQNWRLCHGRWRQGTEARPVHETGKK